MTRFALISVLVFGVTQVHRAEAAFPVDTLEGVGPDRRVPELHLGVRFDQDYTRSTITREFINNAAAQDETTTAEEVRELSYEAVRRRLVVEARVGIVQSLEFRANIPIVLQWDSNLDFADGVEGQSSVFGSANANDPNFALRFPLTTVPAERNRSGFGDVELGLAYSPVRDGPDTAWPTITFGLMITVPSGDRWDPADTRALPEVDGSGGVGLGQTIFDVSLGMSRRSGVTTPGFDPYLVLGARFPLATGAQEEIGLEPPISARVEVGSEVVIRENEDQGTYYGADFGLQFRYIADGRTFSPLTDYLPDFDQTQVDEDLVTYDDFANPANYSRSEDGASCLVGDPELPGVPCGEITRVDDHIEFEGRLGFRIQPVWWFLFRAGVGVGFANDHLITGEVAGEDTDPDSAAGLMCGSVPCLGRINRENSQGRDERSPFYDPRYDAPGGRFFATDILNVRFFATATATF